MKRPLRHKIDKILRERLEGLYPPYNPAHWERMEEQLEGGALDGKVAAGWPEQNYKDMDEVLFDKMHRYEAPYQSQHWAAMESELQRAFERPAFIRRYKALEAALVLLLCMGLWHYFPHRQAPTDIQAFRIPMLPVQQQKGQTAGLITKEEAERATADRLAVFQEPPFKPNDGQARPGAAITPPSASAAALASRSATVLQLLPLRTQRVAAGAPNFLKGLEALALSKATAKTHARPAAAVPPLGKRRIAELMHDADPLAGVEAARAKRNNILRLGMFASGEYNHIVVPASDDKRLSESFERAAWGYGSGLSLGVDFGRVELETGLVYAARRYPVGLVYLQGSVAGGFEGDELRTTELNIVNLPVHVRYDFVQRGKWRGYVLGGGAVQVAFQTNYFTTDAPPQYNFKPAMPVVSDGGGGGAEKAIDRIRQNGVGWFEGGSFEDNAYLTANLGFGIERFISGRWSLFAQPVYQHSFHYFKNIDGLGPNKDRINSLSISLGTRVRLK